MMVRCRWCGHETDERNLIVRYDECGYFDREECPECKRSGFIEDVEGAEE